MPSSIHEFIVVPKSLGEPRDLTEMVKNINEDVVEPDERLSNDVYYFENNQLKVIP